MKQLSNVNKITLALETAMPLALHSHDHRSWQANSQRGRARQAGGTSHREALVL
jgi:hypothetical protein